MRTRLSGFVCYILVTLLFAAAKTSAQTNTNCALVMTCPSNIVVTSCFNVQEFYTPTASNICCGVNSSVTCTPPSGSIFAVGTATTVTCTATDCDQNTNFCTFTVTVVQGTNCATNCLDIQCPSNIVVTSCTNIQEFYAPTVTDSCCSNWNVTCTPASGSYFAPNTTNLVICSVTDYCGMSNDCSFTLTVLQGTNCPTNCLQVECPTNKTIPCGTTNWSFDLPIAASCCTNLIGSSGVLTNVVITSLGIQTNGTCQQVITQTWSIVDGCGNSNTCSQIVTVECCATNCINLICPSDIVVTTCSNCATVFYTVTATNGCCFSNVVLNYSLPSGYCFPLGTNTVTVTAHDPDCASTPPTMCSFTVTVVQDTNCCGNLCCGPGVGPQTINWLQLPTNGSTLAPNSSGSNGAGTWIITNLPCYGNVLITQDPVTNVEVLFTKDSPFDDTPNTNGLFEFTETGYGPYSWGTLPGWVDLYYNQVGPVPNYNVSFYFLDGPPSPCSLVLAVIADAQYTTNIVSQPVTFRTEFDLTNSFGQYLSAFTTLDGIFGPNLAPGVNGTVVDSAYSANGIGSDFNTGFALFQPDGALLVTNLPPGNGMDVNGNSYPTPGTNVPYVTFTISHQPGDSFGLTVGYICCPPCPTNCLQIQCPSNKTVECGSTWAFDPPTATSCCTNEYSNPAGPVTNVLITPTSTVTNGSCPQPITITQTWAITDLCGDSNTCSQTVTVIGCCTNPCSGPGLGLQSIQWLQLPTNTTRLLPNPTGANGGGTWIITNLPGYGNVLVVQQAPTNVVVRCTNSDFGRIHAGGSFDNVPTSYGYFDFTETGYGPYTWGVLPGSVELAYGFPYTGSGKLPSYQVSFYFLNGQPNPGSLALAMIGLAQYTTNTISQPFTFRTEYDLLYDAVNYPQGPSADTVLDGTYGPPMIPGVTGTVVSSAYASNGGDDYNTGYAIFQPTNDLLTATLPSGSGFDVNLNPYPSLTNPCPYITITVDNHEIDDIFSLTVGYLCCTNCPTNCLQIIGSTNKTVQCGSNWMFDPPTAISCCTNEFVTGPATETNVLITAITTVTNGACPEPMQVTRTWSIIDGCGDSNTWSQTVTVLGCCTNCLMVYCPSNKTVACDSGWMFDVPTATTCCTNEIDTELGVTNVLITPMSTITNGACPSNITVTQIWSIVDACGNSNSCSQIVTLTNCCSSPCIQVECPSNIVVATCSNCVPVYYTANATVNGFCCTNIAEIVYDPPSGTCFNLGVSNVTVSVYACGFVTNCGFTVTVLADTNCCTNAVTNINLNTGYDPNSNNVYSYGQADATWWVTKDPTLPPTTVPRPATVVDPNLAWFAAQPDSGWISSYATDADTLNGEYDFQTYFCTAADATNLVLNICLRADDVAVAALNGNLIPLSSTNTTFYAPVPACGTVVNPSWFNYGGENVLTVYVTNVYGVAMGLNAEVSVSGSGLLPVGSPCCPLASGISGQKFDDMNCNGIQDPGEPGLSGWTIQLSYGTNIVTNVTDVNGYYYFTNLPPGAYTVTEVQQVGWSQSAPVGGSYTVTLTNLQQINNLNFGNCNTNVPTNCINLTCPSNIVVTTCSNCAQVFYSASASDFCCNPGPAGAPVTLTYNPPSGTCFEPGVTAVQVTAIDECQNIATCSFTVTVLSGSNQCCGPGLGLQTIQWLQLPTNGNVLSDPSGTNLQGSWIVTNLPCYGNVLMTQNFPDLVYWFLNPYMVGASNSYGRFNFTENGYGPYDWGTGAWMDFFASNSDNYTVTFYFLDGPPNPCNLVLGVAGLAANTTATISQPMTFQTEYDINYSSNYYANGPSAYTEFDGTFGTSLETGVNGVSIGSAYNATNYGDYLNTGLAVLQPDTNLPTTNLTSSSVQGYIGPLTGLPYLSLSVQQQAGDGIGFTVGYICCNPCSNSPCLQLQCSSNKTVECDSGWTFDMPTATSCCTNYEFGGGTGSLTNVLITPISTVTNGACPQLTITQTWSIIDGCGNSNTCSQMVTVTNCCTNCLQINCPTNKSAQCGSNWMFDAPTATSCCASNFPGTSTNVLITVTSTMTNGVCPQVITRNWAITDACGESNMCSQVVTVVDTTPPMITCPTNTVVVALNTNCQFVIPTVQVSATDNCTPVCSLVYSQSPTNGTIVSGTNAVVTVTVTDLCGNSNSCHVLVEGKPETGPVVTIPTSIIISNCVVPCLSNYLTATDNCCPPSSLKITQSVPCGDLIASGGETVTVTVTDCHGNATTKTVHLVPSGSNTFLANLTNTGSMVSSYISVTTAPDPNNLLADGVQAAPYTLPHSALDLCAGLSIPVDYSGYPVAVSDVANFVPWTLAPDPANRTLAVSKWIAPDLVDNRTCPCGTYTYSLPFTLPADFIANTATISGRWAADNGAVGMLINSTVTGNVMLPTNARGDLDGFAQWTPFTINSGFLSGANTLQFVVTNQPLDGNAESATGLRVEFTSAYASCATCAAPSIISISPAQSLQEYSAASFTVKAGGTAPLSYQWQLNNNNIAGATNSTLRLPSIGYAAAGLYSVIIANPCGVTTGLVRLTVTQPLPWPNGSWTVGTLANPLGATFGPDLVLTGSSYATNFAINVGTTEDFGLPGEGGQTVNVMDINPAAGGTIGLPLIAEPGSYSDTNYTLIMDIYEPDTSLGTPSTLFQSIACCVSNLGSGGQDGVGLTLDASNYLHVTGAIGGTPFDDPSATPMTVDAWHRVALAVDGGLGGIGGSATLYSDGQTAVAYYPCLCCPLPVPVLWTNTGVVTNSMQVIGSPTILSAPTDTLSTNGEFYVSGIQFHAIAMTPQMIAGIGSPASGPAPMNETSVSAAPVLSAALSNGVINLTWSGNAYVLQETTGLSGGVWVNSALPFTETEGTAGNIMTTATVTPATGGPSKFYRLVFSP